MGSFSRLDGIGDAPACCSNGFRGLQSSFRGLSQHRWSISV